MEAGAEETMEMRETGSRKKNLILMYWKCRGLAEHIRTLLEYLKEEYTSQHLEQPSSPPSWRVRTEEWTNIQDSLKTPFPSLPNLQEGELTLTGSLPIARYLCLRAGRGNMCGGDNIIQQAKLEGLAVLLYEIRMKLTTATYADNWDIISPEVLAWAASKMDLIYAFLGEREWLGEQITYLDFFFAELLEYLAVIVGHQFWNRYPNFTPYLQRFLALDGVASYRNSERFKEVGGFNNQMAYLQI